MSIGINGLFLLHPKTGMGQYILNILQEECWDFEYTVFVPMFQGKKLSFSPKIESHIVYVPVVRDPGTLLGQVLWESWTFPRVIASSSIITSVFSPYPSLTIIKNKPHYITVHDVIYWQLPEYVVGWKSRLYRYYLKKSITKADHIITISEFSEREIIGVFQKKSSEITTILLGASTRSHHPTYTHVPEQPYILYEGGLDIRKNIPRLIEAFAKLHQEFPEYLLLIPGSYINSPIIPDIVTQIRKLGLQDSVRLLGFVSDDDLQGLLNRAMFLVYPSLYEGFGLPILEGMQAGIPVITSNSGATAEVAGEGAYLIDPQSIDSIYQGMKRMLQNNSLRQEYVTKGYQRVNDFQWKKTASEIGKCLTQKR